MKFWPRWGPNIPPVWGKKIAGADRFEAVLDGAAYCDKETGLVWEARAGDTDGDMDVDNDDRVSWTEAISHCSRQEVDDRKGWALPLREQLATLVDTQSALCTGGGSCLPDDHPFSDVQSGFYWSATTVAGNPAFAWGVDFNDGSVFSFNKGVDPYAWCVRGDQSFDGNTHTTLH